jgi:phospholipid/cholesterol/gamma-HCH transport system substrate-binding protein
LPRLDALGEEVSGDARELEQALHQASARPQSFIFGPPAIPPGPGESGFPQGHGADK